LPGLFGSDEPEKSDLDDGRLRASSAVKNVDLYKMHTYNEAIRRTVGSYVLYPGANTTPENSHDRFERYHEIVPGIGAFAVRPRPNGTEPDGLKFLAEFIHDLLTHQLNRFSQSHCISKFTEEVIRDQPIEVRGQNSVSEKVSLPSSTVILGYIRKGD